VCALLLGLGWLPASWAQDVAVSDPVPGLVSGSVSGLVSDVVAEMPAYTLELILATDLASLQGSQTVTFTNTSDQLWDGVYFHLHPNLLGGDMTVLEVLQAGLPLEVRLSNDDSLLYVPVLGGLVPGEQATLQLRYDLTIPQRMGRNYGVLALQDGILSLAHGYATLAVFEDGWDIDIPVSHGDLLNAAASVFSVSVQAPADVTVVTTGKVMTEFSDGETKQLEIEAGVARDFYLSASRNYEVMTATANLPLDNSLATVGRLLDAASADAAASAEDAAPADADVNTTAMTVPVTVRSYYQTDGLQDDTRRQRAKLALEAAVASLELFSARLAPYPYDEFDIVPMVTTALGLEFPGIIGLSSALYEDTSIGRQASLVYLEGTVVHEVVHQWFYNLIGNDQVSEPWLDEATTQYVTWEYFTSRYGANAPETRGFVDSLIGRSRRSNQQKLGDAVAAYSPSQYSAVIYGEGPLVLAELASLLGDAVFWDFLRTYSRDNRWQRIDTQGFERQLEAHCNCVLDEFFETYIR
jgi:hypothetical protein